MAAYSKEASILTKFSQFICCQPSSCLCCPCDCFSPLDDAFADSSDSDNFPICAEQPYRTIRYPSASSRRSSNADSRRSSSDRRSSIPIPVIDMKPIEFWSPTTNSEIVQPRTPTRRFGAEFHQLSDAQIEPKLYGVPEDEDSPESQHLGKIHFGVRYDFTNEQLLVRVVKARDLPPPVAYDPDKIDLAHSNPYVKVSLLPDQINSRQTAVKPKTQAPDFDESFRFDLAYREAQRRLLRLSVQDFDKYSRHCVIGQYTLPLDGINLMKGAYIWKALQPSAQNNPGRGDILISLNYLPFAERLQLDVIKIKQLLQRDINGGSDPFVKIQLLLSDKVIKTKKSSTKKNTIDPVFNESFYFNVSPTSLDKVVIIISVWDYNCKSRDGVTGQINLGKYSSGLSESTHWRRMFESQRCPVAQWHALKAPDECLPLMQSSSTS
ncbi:synaptotagmin-17-like [Anneissia japonica]|uniref:synaptotagmin-17-like n=1 Tax=Anneissia japonica TaxID=1529436 RepID=UPI00142587DA|nr:synaptotagmin-17-like [Anneissia japonica]